MKFVLFVEGHTEQMAVPAFLKRWLDPKLNLAVGIKPVRFEGWSEFVDEVANKAELYLEGPGALDTIAVIGLLDLYGPTFYPPDVGTASERLTWASNFIEKKVSSERFRQFFAVHETEAWLLSERRLFPQDIRKVLPDKAKTPEEVNFDEPPGYLLNRLYKQATRKNYKKVTYGKNLFEKLDPDVAYEKCPNLKFLLDEMLKLARSAGL